MDVFVSYCSGGHRDLHFCPALRSSGLIWGHILQPVIGPIHSFGSWGSVDGPGIRFITFFWGCLMRCLYCHNRDTWDTHGGKEVTVEDLMKEVVTYRHFMNASGGGVTASGGEAILQAEFVRDWFRACKKEGIHTCLDTTPPPP
ncbi:radical SAM protein, partial [Ligilactobacillus salivarius]|nr:radical SAM protein [Ligilactobacillus salivarius]